MFENVVFLSRHSAMSPSPRDSIGPANGDNQAPPYARLLARFRALVEDERDFIANAANCAALLFHDLKNVSWAGFYFRRGRQLVLGPFQGRPACVRIAWGRGVCGTSAQARKALIVPDVRAFAGHIACDPLSRSELVIPLILDQKVIGVLDLDSHQRNRFDNIDLRGLTAMMKTLLKSSQIPQWINARMPLPPRART